MTLTNEIIALRDKLISDSRAYQEITRSLKQLPQYEEASDLFLELIIQIAALKENMKYTIKLIQEFANDENT